MMTLQELLQKKKTAIVARWLDDVLSTYPKDFSNMLGKQADRFANPVGHAIRVGTQAAFEGLMEGVEADETCSHLHKIIKIRAVQQFSPSKAVSFVFLLKKAIRAELAKDASHQRFSSELMEFENQIDQVALLAFDYYARCREQVYELRVNEVKRRVSVIVDK